MSLFLKNLLAVVVIPGTVVVLIPFTIVRGNAVESLNIWSLTGVTGLCVLGVGAALMFSCILDFAIVGRGTLSPTMPPARLVTRGLYQYMRNPMYFGALLVLSGEILIFRSTRLLVYAALWFSWCNVFIVFYEEPTLRHLFGASYEDYCRNVGRWIPREPRAEHRSR